MDSKLTPVQAGPHQDGDVVLVAPKDWTYVDDALHVSSNQRRATAGSDFSAGPRMTEPSLDPTLRPADVNNDPLPTDRPSTGRRTSRSLARFLVAVCVGVAATLAWQSYGGMAKQMIANSAPRLSGLLLSSPPAMNQPSGRETAIEQPNPPAVQASAPQAPPAQAGAVASTASEKATSTAPGNPSRELQQQLQTMEQDLAAVRQSVEQLAAGQEQMARDIAKLHTAGQDIRRRTSALPPAATTSHKPVPPPQVAPQSSTAPLTYPPPQAAPQSAAPLTYPPAEPAPQSSAGSLLDAPPEPPRPPMPVR
jgi:pimeloyl-ACP methyl ester carboxylesterase